MEPQTFIKARDNTALFFRHWPVTAGAQPKGTVLIVHGLGEHIGRYEHVAAHLNAAGWQAAAYDQRGHGQSEGKRGVITQADDLLFDLATVIDHLRAATTGKLVLLGHSMGGAVVARFVTAPSGDFKRQVDGMALSSPALATGIKGGQAVLLKVMETLAPGFGAPNGLNANFVARDPAVVAAYRADPLVHPKVCARLVRFIIDAGQTARDEAPNLKVPSLLLYAGTDRLVVPGGSDSFSKAAPGVALQVVRYDSMYHEIFNDPEKHLPLGALTDWLMLTLALEPSHT